MLSVLFWGVSFVSTKIVLTDLPPVSIAFFRQFAAIVPLLILMGIRRENFRLRKGEYAVFAVASLFGIVLYFVFENNGLKHTSASSASVLVAAIPVFTLIIESIRTRKRMSVTSLVCVMVSFIGVYCVIFEKGGINLSGGAFLGNLLVFCAMASWIIYTFISDSLSRRYSSLKLTTVQTIMSIPLFVPFIASEIHAWKMPSREALGSLIFLGVFCSGLAYVFFLYGLQNLGPVVPSAFLNLIPVITIATGMVVLHEEPSLLQTAGAVLIVGSLTFLSLIKLKEHNNKINGGRCDESGL